MEVITMESSALKMLTEQIADVAKLVALIYSNARENTKRRSMELVLTSSDAARILGDKQANPAALALYQQHRVLHGARTMQIQHQRCTEID